MNGIEMVGKTQSDAVLLLRETPLGGSVSMLVSRIVLEDDETSAATPAAAAAAAAATADVPRPLVRTLHGRRFHTQSVLGICSNLIYMFWHI